MQEQTCQDGTLDMPDEQTVERVARAIWYESHGKHRKNNKWPEDVIGGSQDLFRSHARAAIAAMPQDTEALEAELIEHACAVIDAFSEYDQNECCDGRECGCQGSSVHDHMKHMIRAARATKP